MSSSHSGQMLLGVAALVFIWMVFYCLGWIILQYRETLPLEVGEKAETRSLSRGRFCAGAYGRSSMGVRLLNGDGFVRAVATLGRPLPDGHGSEEAMFACKELSVSLMLSSLPGNE